MKKQLILIVDDNIDNLQLLGKMLRPLNADISFANSAAKALDILNTLTPNLIVLDIIMPDMDGFELCKIIQKDETIRDIPVIFLSAKDNIDDITNGFTLGARDFVTKPFIKEELISRISTQLDIRAKELALYELNSNLEKIVENRTEELSEKNDQLVDYNATLKVLLNNRDNERKEIERRIVANVHDSILPALQKLKTTSLDHGQTMLLVQSIENLQNIVSPMMSNLKNTLALYGFTPTELTIVNYITKGMRTSEISETLNLSESTVNFHRNNIRGKLNLKNKKVNLNVYLNQLANKETPSLHKKDGIQ